MHDRTWMTRPHPWPRMRPPLPLLMATGLLTVVCLLFTGCTRVTGTAQPPPPGTEVVTADPAEATWQGTFQVDGQPTDVPAHVGSAGCTAIGLMTLDLHRDTIGTQGSVSGRLRVGTVTLSGPACGRRDRSRGSLQATLSCDGSCLRADRFRLLGVGYDWLVASIRSFPVGPTMQSEQLQGRFGGGHSHHRSLHGTFTLAATVARGNIGAVERTEP
jgi:hypothetical protein